MQSEFNNAVPVAEQRTSTKPLALIVDDETDICFLLKDILQKKFESCSVTTLADAKRYLQINEPAVIFLDNKLTDGLGVDNIYSFKKQYPHTKIVMMTAYDNFSDRETAMKEGADYFINKPFSIQTIMDTVQKII
jgi:DNA-binding NtrC family response regulator